MRDHNTRLCVPTDALLVALGHVVSVTEHAILSTFSRWFEVTFDNPNTAQYVVLFGHASRDLQRVFSDALAVRGHVLAGMPMYSPFLGTTDLLLTLLQPRYPHV